MDVLVIAGGDDVLRAAAIDQAIEKALGKADRSLALEIVTEDNFRVNNAFELYGLVEAAETPPFLTDIRVVVGRHIGRFSTAAELQPLMAYLEAPLVTTSLILVWEKGRDPVQQRLSPVPKALVAAVETAGGSLLDCSVGRGREANRWIRNRLDDSEVDLTPQARQLLVETLGEDRSRVLRVLAILRQVFGSDRTLSRDDVEPYLGRAGDVAPWELTDAIGVGDIRRAIECLHRMLGAGGRHPLAVLAVLHIHYERLLRLDGSGITDHGEAASMLGISVFPAKKALSASRRLGSLKISRAIKLISRADLDLRGKTAWPPELVAEVLVARLASISAS